MSIGTLAMARASGRKAADRVEWNGLLGKSSRAPWSRNSSEPCPRAANHSARSRSSAVTGSGSPFPSAPLNPSMLLLTSPFSVPPLSPSSSRSRSRTSSTTRAAAGPGPRAPVDEAEAVRDAWDGASEELTRPLGAGSPRFAPSGQTTLRGGRRKASKVGRDDLAAEDAVGTNGGGSGTFFSISGGMSASGSEGWLSEVGGVNDDVSAELAGGDGVCGSVRASAATAVSLFTSFPAAALLTVLSLFTSLPAALLTVFSLFTSFPAALLTAFSLFTSLTTGKSKLGRRGFDRDAMAWTDFCCSFFGEDIAAAEGEIPADAIAADDTVSLSGCCLPFTENSAAEEDRRISAGGVEIGFGGTGGGFPPLLLLATFGLTSGERTALSGRG